jgi:hypothetical protein
MSASASVVIEIDEALEAMSASALASCREG